MTLLILAAGMGSRFGGLKQIEPVGPNGEFIIDYSIYDAIKAGFDKVVFVIKRENYEIFRDTVGKRFENKIEVAYSFQEINEPSVPKDRVKPLGTAHAILCAKDNIDENFVIINADDFYGYDAFLEIANFMKNNTCDYGLVGYEVKNTLTLNGSVKRGYIEVDEDGDLAKIKESNVCYEDDKIKIAPFDGSTPFYAKEDSLVSMNMIGFTKALFDELEKEYKVFLDTADLSKDEYLIPDVLCKQIDNKDVKCKVIRTNSVWKGITYSADLQELKDYILKQVEMGLYPEKL